MAHELTGRQKFGRTVAAASLAGNIYFLADATMDAIAANEAVNTAASYQELAETYTDNHGQAAALAIRLAAEQQDHAAELQDQSDAEKRWAIACGIWFGWGMQLAFTKPEY